MRSRTDSLLGVPVPVKRREWKITPESKDPGAKRRAGGERNMGHIKTIKRKKIPLEKKKCGGRNEEEGDRKNW